MVPNLSHCFQFTAFFYSEIHKLCWQCYALQLPASCNANILKASLTCTTWQIFKLPTIWYGYLFQILASEQLKTFELSTSFNDKIPTSINGNLQYPSLPCMVCSWSHVWLLIDFGQLRGAKLEKSFCSSYSLWLQIAATVSIALQSIISSSTSFVLQLPTSDNCNLLKARLKWRKWQLLKLWTVVNGNTFQFMQLIGALNSM